MLSQRNKIIAQYLYILSLIFICTGFFIAFATYDMMSPAITGHRLYGIADYIWLLIPVSIIFYILLFAFQMYANLNIKDFKADVVQFFEITLITVFLLFAILFMFRITYISRLFVGYFAVYSFLSLILADFIGGKFTKGLKRRGYSMRNILLVNGSAVNTSVIGNVGIKETIKSKEYLGIKLIKEIDKDDLGNLENFVLNNPIDEVIFNITGDELADIKDIALFLEEKGITVRILTNFVPFKYSKVSLERLGDYSFISFYTSPEDDIRLFTKRMVDIFGSLVAMIVFMIPSIVIAILIKLTSKGHVLYKSKRVGKNGRLFTFYKFRTMNVGSDGLREKLLRERSRDGIEIKLKDDPRLTAIGKFMRKASIDELPQFYNVLRGDMSIVGPRPPMPDEVVKYSTKQRRRISMKPGITCLLQISGRSRLTFDDRVKLDLKYIDNWSLKLDFIIILKTVPAVLFAKGAL